MRYKIVDRKKRIATRLVDALGAVLSLPFRWIVVRPSSIKAPPESILVIREAYLGDVVMTLPVLAPLRRMFPSAKISFLTSVSAAPVLWTNPYVDEILPFDAPWFYRRPWKSYFDFVRGFRRRSFDLVIEARGDIRDILLLAMAPKSRNRIAYGYGGGSWMLTGVVPYPVLKHKVEAHLDIVRFLKCECGPLEWGFYFTPDEMAQAGQILRAGGVCRPFLVVHPGSRMPLKRWPPEKCSRLYARLMRGTNFQLVIVGTPDERNLVREIMERMETPPINLSGALDVRQLAAVLSLARLLVCNDSAPMHFSACVGTPTVAIFGPSDSLETGPFGDGHRVVERKMDCRAACNESVCRNPQHQACMHTIEVGEVFDVVMEALGGVSA